MVLGLALIALAVLAALAALHWYAWRRLVRDTTRGPGPARRAGTAVLVAGPVLMVAALVAERTGAPFWLQRVLGWPGFLWMAVSLYLLLALVAGELVRLPVNRLVERRARTREASPGPAPVPAGSAPPAPEANPDSIPPLVPPPDSAPAPVPVPVPDSVLGLDPVPPPASESEPDGNPDPVPVPDSVLDLDLDPVPPSASEAEPERSPVPVPVPDSVLGLSPIPPPDSVPVPVPDSVLGLDPVPPSASEAEPERSPVPVPVPDSVLGLSPIPPPDSVPVPVPDSVLGLDPVPPPASEAEPEHSPVPVPVPDSVLGLDPVPHPASEAEPDGNPDSVPVADSVPAPDSVPPPVLGLGPDPDPDPVVVPVPGPDPASVLAVPSRRLFVSRVVGGAVAAAAVGTVGYGTYGVLRGPAVKRITVPLARLPRSAHGFRVAVVSDIHLGPVLGRGFAQRVVDTINSTQPDLIAVVGDLVDGSVKDLGPAAAPLAQLKARHGSYFVTGNHEYFSGADQWVAEVRRLGLHPLENARTELPAFDLAGVNDLAGESEGEGPDFTRALGDRDSSRAVVLLAHQPAQIHEAVKHHVDLQLSGHTQGFGVVARRPVRDVLSDRRCPGT